MHDQQLSSGAQFFQHFFSSICEKTQLNVLLSVTLAVSFGGAVRARYTAVGGYRYGNR